jgi:DNA-binding transcriptional regulator YbjK
MAPDGRNERGERTRRAMLDASMAIIAESGAAAATQRSVAVMAATSLASTTYHFGTRSGLLEATLEHAAQVAITEIETLREEIVTGRTELVDACLGYITRQRTGQSHTAAVVFELALTAARMPTLRTANESFLSALRSLFAPFTPAGEGIAVAESFYGVLLLELARGESGPSPDLERTITTVFDAYGITAAVERLRSEVE